MRSVIRLAELNDIDLQVDATKARLGEIVEALKEPAALKQARAALVQAESALAVAQARQQTCEVAQRKAQDKLTRTEQQLYSGKVTNAKELENQQADLAQLRRQLEHCDDELLEALIAVETATAEQNSARATVERLSAEHEVLQARLREEQARLTKRLAAERARQATARAAAPAELLPSYDSLRVRRAGRAVARLEGDTCGVCRVTVSPTVVDAAFGETLVYCENCGRLLCAE